MNLFQSEKSYDELIRHIRDCGYIEICLSRIKREIRWLTKNKDAYGISSYREACLIREKQTKSTTMQQQQRAIYGLFRQYSITHLREFAISIEAYPIREEVFQW